MRFKTLVTPPVVVFGLELMDIYGLVTPAFNLPCLCEIVQNHK